MSFDAKGQWQGQGEEQIACFLGLGVLAAVICAGWSCEFSENNLYQQLPLQAL